MIARSDALSVLTDVRCNGGDTKAIFPPDAFVALPVAVFSLFGEESLRFAVHRDDERTQEILRNRVVMIHANGSVAGEWRIANISDAGTGEDAVTVVQCFAITADLSRAVYRDADAEGVPFWDYAMADATASDVLAGPVADALAAAGLTWIVAGTVDAAVDARVFDQSGEYESARQIIAGTSADERAPSEFRLRRNGDTDYRIDLLEAVGGDAATLHLQPAKNLVSLRRQRLYSDYATRVLPRGKQDQTHRGIGYAYFVIVAIDTSTPGAHRIQLADPRGGSYPGPFAFDNQHNDRYLAQIDVAFLDVQIDETLAATQEAVVADSTGFIVGRWVEFRTASGVSAPRIDSLEAGRPDGLEYDGGLVERILDKSNQGLSGAVNYCPNPAMAAWANHSNPPDGYTKVTDAGTVTGTYNTSETRFGGASYKISGTGGANFGRIRTPELLVYDDGALAYQVWAWVYINTLGASDDGRINVGLKFASDLTDAASSVNLGVAEVGVWTLVRWEVSTMSKSGQGLVIDVRCNGATFAAWAVSLDAVGCQPLAWERSDTYTPDACDLYHAGNAFLLQSFSVAQYDGAIVDFEQLHHDGTTSLFPDDALVIGQTAKVYEPALNFGTVANPVRSTTQRLLEFTRYYFSAQPTVVRFGTPRVSFTEWMAQRTRLTGPRITKTDTAAVALEIAESLELAAAAGRFTGENDLAIAVVDSGGTPTGDVANVTESDIAQSNAKSLRKVYGQKAVA